MLEAAGSSLSRVVKTTMFLTDLSVFPRVNAVYARHFISQPAPARSTIQVAGLPLGVPVEIEAIASEVIAELNVTSMKQMGQVMQAVLARTGARADGKAVNQVVRRLLTP